jgi:hypothetical protein
MLSSHLCTDLQGVLSALTFSTEKANESLVHSKRVTRIYPADLNLPYVPNNIL